ncbi:hypothetical protein NPX13_g6671 [Xylaria arbuscula]|uniref:Uncharacterized protein n=1 Tax=Xylaria arbuscula TaxID=114810 RepID=A0A9W8NBE9_9PEZI|nr:hypothetical protein NPX13_g6671 [Xylaria arbuscula]
MSSKELLGPAIKTLAKKVSSFSLASRKDHDGDHQPPVQAQVHANSSVALVSLAMADASNNGDSTSLARKSTEWVDVIEVAPATSATTSDPVQQGIQVTDTQLLDAATACFPPVPEDAELLPLPKPVVIPRLDSKGALYLSREDFVAFIDNLNIVTAPNVTIQVLGVTGGIVGLVPYDIAQGVGGALEGIAIISAIAVNYKRTRDYLALMNEKYFHPRKLHVKIINTKRLKKLLRLEEKDALLAPLTEDTLELSSQERCLKYLSEYSCGLTFDVPAPRPATTTLARITAWQIKQKIRKADETAKSARKRTWKRHQKGKKLQGRWESMGEKSRVKSLDWILVQNLGEWEARKAEKESKRKEKKNKKGGEEQPPTPT